AELGEHLAPPVAQLLDPLVYHPRWRLSFLRPALPHDVSFFPFLLFLAARVRHHRAPTTRDHGSRADSSLSCNPLLGAVSVQPRRPPFCLTLSVRRISSNNTKNHGNVSLSAPRFC